MKEAQVTPVSFDGIMHAAFGFAARCARKEIDPEALEALRERNVANVLIDGPGHHVGTEQTADHAYVRFHGRNYDIWYKGEEKDDHRLNRYDYLYRKEQLESWVPRINEAELKAVMHTRSSRIRLPAPVRWPRTILRSCRRNHQG